jgi:hypothetical protein
VAKQKPKRAYRMIGFKAYFDIDQEIIDWWESMDEGVRSDAIRDLIHDALVNRLQYMPEPITTANSLPDLDDLKRDTRWIRDALHDMPAYLEQLLTHAISIQVPTTLPDTRAPTPDAPALDDAESQRRARKLKRVSW